MVRNINKPNPKSLKIDGLGNIKKKVTVGFKCHPELKLHLIHQAKKSALTLSEYVETLIQQTDKAIQLEKAENDQLKDQLAFYENDILLRLYEEYQQKTVDFIAINGEKQSIKINSLKDMYTILINSFKIKP